MRSVTAVMAALAAACQLIGCAGPSHAPEGVAQGYIVQLKAPPLVSYTGGIAGLAPTSPRSAATGDVDLSSPASQAYLAYLKSQQVELIAAMQGALGRPVRPVYSYYYAMDGFSVRLTPAEAARVAGLPDVASVRPDRQYPTLPPGAGTHPKLP